MDWYSECNQTYIAKEDVQKAFFCCPSALGMHVCKTMLFELKNARCHISKSYESDFS